MTVYEREISIAGRKLEFTPILFQESIINKADIYAFLTTGACLDLAQDKLGLCI